jgi:glycosyl transferase family 2
MKVVALMPVRNEAWVLPHSLACLSAFCDAILVNDQNSDDDSRAICRRFPKVQLLESPEALVCEQARWQLLDAARGYEGHNLLWWSDADELVAPAAIRRYLDAHRDALTPGTAIEARFVHPWGRIEQYRVHHWAYGPHWKEVALVDDRRIDYDRTSRLPLHQPRVPVDGVAARLRAESVHILHLQWLLARRNQMRQAWYRCREYLDGGKTAAQINELYSITLPGADLRTAPTPAEWIEGLTFPDPSIDREPTWQERDVFEWFDRRTPLYFEPLEIWHIPELHDAFRRYAGRSPRPDRSYRPPWPARAGRFARRIAAGAWRRLPF